MLEIHKHFRHDWPEGMFPPKDTPLYLQSGLPFATGYSEIIETPSLGLMVEIAPSQLIDRYFAPFQEATEDKPYLRYLKSDPTGNIVRLRYYNDPDHPEVVAYYLGAFEAYFDHPELGRVFMEPRREEFYHASKGPVLDLGVMDSIDPRMLHKGRVLSPEMLALIEAHL